MIPNVRSMRRLLIVLLTLTALAMSLSAPVAAVSSSAPVAAADDSSGAHPGLQGLVNRLKTAKLCLNGGYRNYTRADGTTFKNTLVCVAYALKGGQLVPIVVNPFTIVYANFGTGVFSTTITGAGLQPGSAWLLVFLPLGGSASGPVDTAGMVSFSFTSSCDNLLTGVTATGTPAGGVQATYNLPGPDATICPPAP